MPAELDAEECGGVESKGTLAVASGPSRYAMIIRPTARVRNRQRMAKRKLFTGVVGPFWAWKLP